MARRKVTDAEATRQDVVDAIRELTVSVDELVGRVEGLDNTAGALFRAFDPGDGNALEMLLQAAREVASAVRPVCREVKGKAPRRRRNR